jgi:hypothetical protein
MLFSVSISVAAMPEPEVMRQLKPGNDPTWNCDA